MPIIVDGHNLIAKIPGLALNMIDDEIRLIQVLQDYCRKRRKHIDIYFDMAPPGQARSEKLGSVTAHFVREGMTADEAIQRRLAQLRRGARNWTVVSSDRQVQAAARAAHAQVIPSEDFAARVFQASRGQTTESGRDEVEMSDAELDEWLDIFGDEGD
jgi:predicted RNA-binding protein with PIN domain